VAENAYLRSLRAQYEAHEKAIAGLEARAVEAKRDLTNEEMRSIIEMGEKNKSLYTQIEDLSEIELRNAKVAAMQAKVAAAVAGQHPSRRASPGG
jgi:capsule polysaccharide export protein KpsE/RkpR